MAINPKKVLLLNNTSRDIGHLGSQLVMQNISSLCRANNLEIIASLKNQYAYKDKGFKNLIEASDLLLLNGEGTMHHDKATAVALIESVKLYKSFNKPCFLINSVWQDNNLLNDSLSLFDAIFVRENRSREQILLQGKNATVIPDMIFNTVVPWQQLEKKEKKQVIVVDSVLPQKRSYLIRLAKALKCPYWYMGNSRKNAFDGLKLRIFKSLYPCQNITAIEQFNTVQLLISGRFHAVCLAILTHTPFMFIPSNTFKIESMLADVGLVPSLYNFENYEGEVTKQKLYNFIHPIFNNDLKNFDAYINQSKFLYQEMYRVINDNKFYL